MAQRWKLSGRVGVQSFGGAQLPSVTPFKPPIVRLDLDHNDENDNCLWRDGPDRMAQADLPVDGQTS